MTDADFDELFSYVSFAYKTKSTSAQDLVAAKGDDTVLSKIKNLQNFDEFVNMTLSDFSVENNDRTAKFKVTLTNKNNPDNKKEYWVTLDDNRLSAEELTQALNAVEFASDKTPFQLSILKSEGKANEGFTITNPNDKTTDVVVDWSTLVINKENKTATFTYKVIDKNFDNNFSANKEATVNLSNANLSADDFALIGQAIQMSVTNPETTSRADLIEHKQADLTVVNPYADWADIEYGEFSNVENSTTDVKGLFKLVDKENAENKSADNERIFTMLSDDQVLLNKVAQRIKGKPATEDEEAVAGEIFYTYDDEKISEKDAQEVVKEKIQFNLPDGVEINTLELLTPEVPENLSDYPQELIDDINNGARRFTYTIKKGDLVLNETFTGSIQTHASSYDVILLNRNINTKYELVQNAAAKKALDALQNEAVLYFDYTNRNIYAQAYDAETANQRTLLFKYTGELPEGVTSLSFFDKELVDENYDDARNKVNLIVEEPTEADGAKKYGFSFYLGKYDRNPLNRRYDQYHNLKTATTAFDILTTEEIDAKLASIQFDYPNKENIFIHDSVVTGITPQSVEGFPKLELVYDDFKQFRVDGYITFKVKLIQRNADGSIDYETAFADKKIEGFQITELAKEYIDLVVDYKNDAKATTLPSEANIDLFQLYKNSKKATMSWDVVTVISIVEGSPNDFTGSIWIDVQASRDGEVLNKAYEVTGFKTKEISDEEIQAIEATISLKDTVVASEVYPSDLKADMINATLSGANSEFFEVSEITFQDQNDANGTAKAVVKFQNKFKADQTFTKEAELSGLQALGADFAYPEMAKLAKAGTLFEWNGTDADKQAIIASANDPKSFPAIQKGTFLTKNKKGTPYKGIIVNPALADKNIVNTHGGQTTNLSYEGLKGSSKGVKFVLKDGKYGVSFQLFDTAGEKIQESFFNPLFDAPTN
ncbi:lipoprotein 17-related variable surface protein [Mycoplasmopsis gallinarum]|uniref:Putative lipoprotein n=1 Tax=Mycoplasmopsis gallinarum TaxID=29557 RepID=A0A168RH62_9BACT|nr:lipoprotein 17-related variable surface protein [Mycoplasmopsis gallinarum]OAB48982.1 putative lipoprotein [Mycoplasmopsis gallinarum]